MLLSVTIQDDFRREKKRRCLGSLAGGLALSLLAAGAILSAHAQAPGDAANPAASAPAQPVVTAPAVITLEEAIRRAEANEPTYAAASAQSKVSALDRSIARAGLLPSVVYHNQALYTQPNGLTTRPDRCLEPAPKFIANNAVREYASQAFINETLGLAGWPACVAPMRLRRSPRPSLKMARRGLVAAVTGLFYDSLAADHKLAVAERARQEAADFTKLTSEREQAREAAHADVVKAQLPEQQRRARPVRCQSGCRKGAAGAGRAAVSRSAHCRTRCRRPAMRRRWPRAKMWNRPRPRTIPS